MRWAPPWLGRVYSVLRMNFGRSAFNVREAEERTMLGGAKTRLALSKLCSAGWILRLARGSYLAAEPEFIFAALEGRWADDLKGQGIYPCLQAAVGTISRLYGGRLVSLALFGSSARGSAGKTSDIDLLVVADGLSGSYSGRLAELEVVQDACSSVRRAQWLTSGEYHSLDLVALSPEELNGNSVFLLDLTRDAVLIYDRGGLLSGTLADLKRRLAEAGSRRVETEPGRWYWELKPGAKAGERIVV